MRVRRIIHLVLLMLAGATSFAQQKGGIEVDYNNPKKYILEDVRMKLEGIEGVKSLDLQVVFEPEWNKDMMSEEAKLDLGFL